MKSALMALPFLVTTFVAAQEAENPPVDETPGFTDELMTESSEQGHYLNFAMRVELGSEEETAAVGFVVEEDTASLIRIVGPSLSIMSVERPAALHPRATLHYQGNNLGTIKAWREQTGLVKTSLATIMAKVGAFPLSENSDDLVILWSGPKGIHTLEIAASGEGGTVLVEVYRVSADILNGN
ncbi:hypothetical protein [Synoicihabitans lomoniglobus]|uniref:Uncharacterized protein n=1 Tax=Synoicihabitans lomoniglobus TaxID=2909285 RepID=A0AAF0I5N1_9BACT|nr:hypothetical protein [Opitutaceae bacterium LMO-M01]WED67125.1 hypothetical protein PXH66_09705 [Opitutaceae bacterium LMO-M01]